MPFQRPTLTELVQRNDAQISSGLGIGPLIRRSFLGVISRAIAGATHQLLSAVENATRQIFPDTADTQNLERIAGLYKLERKPAAAAHGEVLFTGAALAIVPAGTRLRRSDGLFFQTTAGATLDVDGASAPVSAELGGAAGNSPAGTKLSLVSPISGVASPATVQTPGLIDGLEAESDAELRDRVLVRVRNPPGGGSAADYKRWALEVVGATRAWVQPQRFGPGTVGVAFAADDDAGGPIPSNAQVDLVQAHIDALRPVTAQAFIYAPAALLLDPEITITPDTTETRADVEASLADLLRREGAPGAVVLVSHLRQAIGSAAGVTDYALIAPTVDVVVPVGSLPVVGAVTWS